MLARCNGIAAMALVAATAGSLVSCKSTSKVEPTKPPNILLIVADDIRVRMAAIDEDIWPLP